MRDSRFGAWCMALVWAAWICGGQAFVANAWGSGASATWMPDVLVVMLLAWCARFDPSVLPGVIAVACAARLAFTADPPVAVACGVIAIGSFAFLLRDVAEASAPLLRTALGGLGAVALAAWLILVQRVRDGDHASSMEVWAALPTALSTGICAFALGPLFAKLPGLRAMHEERW